MSKKRTMPLPPLKRDESGWPLCRWCLKRAPTKRHRWCSQECMDEYYIRSSPPFARMKVWERDKGVCAACGVDSAKEYVCEELKEINEKPEPYKTMHTTDLVERGYSTGHLWQADHIKPVCEGGGACGLENLRTLCTSCHKKETSILARRMAGRRTREE